MDEDILRHHGITGQKWGVRRFQNPDGTYTTEGKKRRNSARESSGESIKEKRGLSANQKKTIAAGATAVAAAVAIYGLHKLGKSGKLDELAKRGQELFNKAKDSKPAAKDPKKMSDDELREAVKRMSLEQQYSKLSKSDTKRGKNAVNKVIKAASTVATVTSTSLTIYNNVDRIKKIFEEQSKKRKDKKQGGDD